jgi:hypothetical protein
MMHRRAFFVFCRFSMLERTAFFHEIPVLFFSGLACVCYELMRFSFI